MFYWEQVRESARKAVSAVEVPKSVLQLKLSRGLPSVLVLQHKVGKIITVVLVG